MAKCRVFDDVLSLVHFIAGFVSAFMPYAIALLIFLLYVNYEAIEGRYARDCPGADILEFLVGAGAGDLVYKVVSHMNLYIVPH
jgi:hypothetical protein